MKEESMGDFESTELDNGLTVLSEAIPHVRSVSVGVWIRAGSRHEKPGQDGLAHFVEHMLFKGTGIRSAREIAEEIEAVGGSLNAFTAKEYTCVHSRVLDEHLPIAVDLLGDLVTDPAFDPGELKKERSVIMDEIRLYLDTPDDLVHDVFAESALPGHPLGHPVIGRPETVAAFDRDDALDFWRSRYQPRRAVLAAAGNLRHGDLVDMVSRAFGGWSCQDPQRPEDLSEPLRASGPRRVVVEKPSEQVHVCIGGTGLSIEHEQHFDLQVFNEILGGGSSSRLFQRVREELGLCYAIYSYPSSFTDGGLFTVYCALSPRCVGKTLPVVKEEIDRIREEQVSPAEIARAKAQITAGMLMAMESTSARASRLGKQRVLLGRVPSLHEMMSKIEGVTRESLSRIARTVADWDRFCTAIVGPGDAVRRSGDGRIED